jgi:hypothetical protein
MLGGSDLDPSGYLVGTCSSEPLNLADKKLFVCIVYFK